MRAETAEALAAQSRADLAAECDRHDLGLAELRGQLAQLLALQPGPRRSTKAVGTSADTVAGIDRATNSVTPIGATDPDPVSDEVGAWMARPVATGRRSTCPPGLSG